MAATQRYMLLPLHGLRTKSILSEATRHKASMQKPGIVLGIVRTSRFVCPRRISDQVVSVIVRAISEQNLSARLSTEGEKVFVEYEPLAKGSGYLRPTVMLEFGARSTGEPWEIRDVRCDAADHLPSAVFPTATPQVMSPERTFWEKATAIRVFCVQGQFRGGERFVRHWHDVTRLDRAGSRESCNRQSGARVGCVQA